LIGELSNTTRLYKLKKDELDKEVEHKESIQREAFEGNSIAEGLQE
jgi:hypothetical protein